MRARDISALVKKLMSAEDRKDAEFRYLLLSTEIGDIGKYLTHDSVLNPGARPHGSKEDEMLAYGQCEVMFRSLCYIRGIDYDLALMKGLKNWEEADWRKRKAIDEGAIKGFMVTPIVVSGQAYVVDSKNTLENMAKKKEHRILVLKHATPDIIIAHPYITGIITDNGGRTCHAANISRELGIPCILGAGNATKIIKHDDYLSIGPYGSPEKEMGEVTIVKTPKL
jgi:phosphohistidine swiveling domain-containing protein